MGDLIAFDPSGSSRRSRRSGRRLAMGLVPGDTPLPRRAVLTIDDVAIVCAIAGTPVVGDSIECHVPAVVARVRVTHDGELRIQARRAMALRVLHDMRAGSIHAAPALEDGGAGHVWRPKPVG